MRALPALLFAALLALPPPAEGQVQWERNLIYGHGGGVPLSLDLARPASGEHLAAVLCLHGGGWREGDKAYYQGVLQAFAERGYVAASANYRLAPAHKFPAQVEDAKCAVRYLRSRAGELRLDPDRLAALGDSAGGHLALMLGLTDERDGLEGGGGHAGFSSRVAAVVNFYGPTDLAGFEPSPILRQHMERGHDLGFDRLMLDFLGTTDRAAPIMRRASPTTYIDERDPPVLTFHGDQDPIVPLAQARLLHEKLQAAGVKNTLVVVPLGGHGWGGPALERTVRQTLAFLDRELRGLATSALPAPAR